MHVRALGDLEFFLKMIVECYGPHRVYQWGALLHPERFRDYSDIDIGVEGTMSPEAYFQASEDALPAADLTYVTENYLLDPLVNLLDDMSY